MVGYYTFDVNFSIRNINGQWCLFARQPNDINTDDPIICREIYYWRCINYRKFLAGK